MQKDAAGAASIVEYLPASQSLHSDNVMVIRPFEYFPDGHLKQLLNDDAPGVSK